MTLPPTRSRPTVLIGFAEAFAAIESAWSLQEAGFTVAAFGRAGRRPALRRVRGVSIHEVPAPELDAAATAGALRRLVSELRPSVVLPLDDHAVWICSRPEDVGAPVAGPTAVAAEYALDKSLQIAAAGDAGLAVPPTEVVSGLGEAGPVRSAVMVKPAHALYELDGRLTRPTGVVCADAEEFRVAAMKPWSPPVLIQPLIHGVGEGLFGHASSEGVLGWSAHRRVRMVNPQGSASSACRSVEVDRDLVAPAERFLRSIGWRGMFMLEFLRDSQGTPWFMELNGRAWGSMALARRRGLEYPAWTVKATLEPGFQPAVPTSPPDLLCRNLGLELVHLMFVARGPQSDAQTSWPRFRDAVRDVCRVRRSDRLYNWNPAQPGVLVADTLSTLGDYGRRMARGRP